MATRSAGRQPVGKKPPPSPKSAPAPAQSRRDYTQPPPGGTHYPWEPGGGSKIPGVPDNWQQFYPNEGEGRGDAWIGPKKAQLNAEHPPASYQNMPSARDRFAGNPQGFANWQHQNAGFGPAMDPHAWLPGEIHDTGSAAPNWADQAIAHQQQLNQGYAAHGGARPGFAAGGPLQGTPLANPRGSGPLTYTPGGAYPPAAGGPAPQTGPGSAQAWQRLGAANQGAQSQAQWLERGQGGGGMPQYYNGLGGNFGGSGAPMGPYGQLQGSDIKNLSYQMTPQDIAREQAQSAAHAGQYGSMLPGGGQGQWMPGPNGMNWQAGGGMSPMQNFQHDMMGPMGGAQGLGPNMIMPGVQNIQRGMQQGMFGGGGGPPPPMGGGMMPYNQLMQGMTGGMGGGQPMGGGSPFGGQANQMAQQMGQMFGQGGPSPQQIQQMTGGKVFVNKNGAMIDRSDPNNRQRLTGRQGRALPQYQGL